MPSAVRRATSSMISRASCEAVISRKTSSSAPCASYASAASTGSPASRKSTKRTPLTTRPSLTSRHGMTRLANILPMPFASFGQLPQGLGEIDRAGVERVPHHAALHAGHLGEPSQVVEPRHAARREDGDGDRASKPRSLVHVGPYHEAVA